MYQRHNNQNLSNMASEMCSLKWNDFQQNVVTSFNELRADQVFCDVTLVCGDNQTIEAHRVILAACSPFFNTVLKRNKHSHPMIYMRGMDSKYLRVLMDFVYYGEANVFREDLDEFFALARELNLKGINIYDEKPQQQIGNIASFESFDNHEKGTIKEENTETCNEQINQQNSNIKEHSPVVLIESSKITMTEGASNEELEATINSMIECNGTDDMKFKCNMCGKEERQKVHLKRHVESHIEGVSYPCEFCEKTSKSSRGLYHHVKRHHNK